MGSGIAAHFANAGIEVVLLDIVPPNLTDAEKRRAFIPWLTTAHKEK